jgi:D-alanyl-lipoteichoic acid acyltransferase DltB (MBOAT superfamily)
MSTLSRLDATEGLIRRPVAAETPAARPAIDPREARATRSPLQFAVIAGQLGVLWILFKMLRVEEPTFLVLSGLAFAGFAIHYWLPFAYKEPFWLLLSVGGAFVLLDATTAALVLLLGAVFYGIAASPVRYSMRVGAIVTIGALLVYARGIDAFELPPQFWPVLGAIFMFRLMVYLYDLRHLKGRPSAIDFVRYFFLLPNYYFLLFPVVDFQTLRKSYFQRNIHDVAQQGVLWMVRGAVQLLLYRLVYYLKGPSNAPEAITSFGSLALAMVMTYLLYLRVSGHFHIIVGMLHLFGYDLPETHRKYLLASSLTDFWRRINIYWKDFMVKLVYFPVYFRLRRSGEVRAQIVATALVFTTTWLLHSYQWFWLRGEILLTWPDTLFWGVLGVLVTVNLLVERRWPPRKTVSPGPSARVVHALKVAGTFVLITTLWSMWNAPSMTEWFDVLTWWRIG